MFYVRKTGAAPPSFTSFHPPLLTPTSPLPPSLPHSPSPPPSSPIKTTYYYPCFILDLMKPETIPGHYLRERPRDWTSAGPPHRRRAVYPYRREDDRPRFLPHADRRCSDRRCPRAATRRRWDDPTCNESRRIWSGKGRRWTRGSWMVQRGNILQKLNNLLEKNSSSGTSGKRTCCCNKPCGRHGAANAHFLHGLIDTSLKGPFRTQQRPHTGTFAVTTLKYGCPTH